MKIIHSFVGASCLALTLSAANLHGQNVGIGFSNPLSKLAVNGNFAVGGDYNAAAPTNGAIIEGNVGIGTTTPFAPLHVGATGSPNFIPSGSPNVVFFNYLNTNTSGFTIATYSAGAQPVSALFASNIWSNGSIVSYSGAFTNSDARLKNIIGQSNSAKDLETLEKIEVTDYTMKDVVKFGTKPFKKVIAQQVEKVYPTAVTSGGVPGFTFTPDVYAVSESVKMGKPGVYTISLAKAHGLKTGDTVRLITSKNPELNAIAHVVSDKAFTIETKEPLGEKVFVFGKQCTDLKAVDYDAISMLNVSATQELAKKVETLEQENLDLKNEAKRLTTIEEQQNAKIAALEAMATEMEALKKVVATMQEKENGQIQTVALGR